MSFFFYRWYLSLNMSITFLVVNCSRNPEACQISKGNSRSHFFLQCLRLGDLQYKTHFQIQNLTQWSWSIQLPTFKSCYTFIKWYITIQLEWNMLSPSKLLSNVSNTNSNNKIMWSLLFWLCELQTFINKTCDIRT